jgi:hypothetical protein
MAVRGGQMNRLFGLTLTVTLILSFDASGQDTVVVLVGEPSRPARRAVALFNATSTMRFFGEASIARNRPINAPVGVLGGPLIINGLVRGDVVAINADVILGRGAEVRGDIFIVGGELFGLNDAMVTGNTSAYTSRVPVIRDGSRIRFREERQRITTRRRRPSFSRFDDGFDVVVGADTYNRVEGLPIHLGPRFRWAVGDFGRVTIEGVGIIRTAGDFDETREDFGYRARTELTIANGAEVTVGARAYDLVAPIEAWKLSNEEVGLGTFLWHRDYRDYFLRKGFAGYIRIQPEDHLTLSGEVARTDEASIAARDPWTLFRRDEVWRPNTTIDEGTFTSIKARLEFHSPNDNRHRRSGWYMSLEWERGMSDSVLAVGLPAAIRDPLPSPDYMFDRAFIDVRRYLRAGWAGQLVLRAVGAGSFGDDPLPVQRRLSLGGPEPMPGFAFRQVACNETAFDPAGSALCDRLLLFQAEYRGGLWFSTDWRDMDVRRRRDDLHRDRRDWDDWFWFDGPEFILFTNVGTAWIEEDGPGDFEADVGVGVTLGDFGVYGAKALTQSESLRVIMRVNRRF